MKSEDEKKQKEDLFKELKRLSKKYNFNLAEPIGEMDRDTLNLLLYGDPNQESPSEEVNISDADRWYTIENGGVEAMLIRSYRDTTSDSIRKWAEQYMEQETCSSCKGYRLKQESLSFKLDGLHIGQLSAMNLGTLAKWLTDIEMRLTEKQNEIAS